MLIASIVYAVAQYQVPADKNEAATPAAPAQQSAPPDKIAPGTLDSPGAGPPDAKAEANAPTRSLILQSSEPLSLEAPVDAPASGHDLLG